MKALAAGAWFVLSCVLGCLLALIRWRDVDNGHRFCRMVSWGVLPLLGLRVRLLNGERLTQLQPCVYVANHQSFLDVPILASVYPSRTLVVGKKELLKIPFFGLMFYAMGNVLLDRARSRSAIAAMEKVASEMKKDGFSVWVFPEGHRNAGRPMLPFKKGAFYLALQARVPVVPIVCGQYSGLIDPRYCKAEPGVIEVRVLEPILTDGPEDMDVQRLMRLTREQMEEALSQADANTGSGK